jgi:hypothetical protein
MKIEGPILNTQHGNDVTWKAFCSLVDERWFLNECQVALVGNFFTILKKKRVNKIPMENHLCTLGLHKGFQPIF